MVFCCLEWYTVFSFFYDRFFLTGILLWQLNALQYRRMDFEEFCAASLSVHQLEALERWEQHACCAYELFESDGNRAIVIEELASVSCFLFLGTKGWSIGNPQKLRQTMELLKIINEDPKCLGLFVLNLKRLI